MRRSCIVNFYILIVLQHYYYFKLYHFSNSYKEEKVWELQNKIFFFLVAEPVMLWSHSNVTWRNGRSITIKKFNSGYFSRGLHYWYNCQGVLIFSLLFLTKRKLFLKACCWFVSSINKILLTTRCWILLKSKGYIILI